MHRLFVAIRPPHRVRQQLLAIMGGVSGVRWQTDEQLHVTLKFIGEVDRHKAQDIHAALGSIHQPPFEIRICGIGSFDRRGQPEVLWAGIEPQEPLQALHKKVDQALLRVGVEQERRAYTPHVTLARLKRSSGPVGALLEQSGGFRTPSFPVDYFSLFESNLTPEGAHYSIVERYPLA
jgi:RNA 2',3'-cyclic 3'-phosphodiesterase